MENIERMWFPVRKLGKKFWTLLILLFVLSLGAQALGLVSVYFSAALIGGFLLLAVLLEGWRCGAILACVTPLTGWAIMGLVAKPWQVIWLIVGELIYVSLCWVVAVYLGQKYPLKNRIRFTDNLYRVVLIVGAAASALWSCLAVAFLTALADLLQVEASSSLLTVFFIAIVGSFLLFAALWSLVCRFPRAWALIAGVLTGAVLRCVFLYVTIVNGNADAGAMYGMPHLIGTLLGCTVVIALWLPLHKEKEKKKK